MDTIFPSERAKKLGQKIPSHLGGLQNVVYGYPKEGDLLVFTWGFKRMGELLDRRENRDQLILSTKIQDDGFLYYGDWSYAVYRAIPVINQASACMQAVTSAHNQDLLNCTDTIKDEPPASTPVMQRGPVSMPPTAEGRKALPVASGVIDYFPDALLAVAACSKAGNDQHNPGKPLQWDRSKSGDEGDALMRHFLARGTVDTDGIRHSAKVAWRALALLQKEIEEAHRASA